MGSEDYRKRPGVSPRGPTRAPRLARRARALAPPGSKAETSREHVTGPRPEPGRDSDPGSRSRPPRHPGPGACALPAPIRKSAIFAALRRAGAGLAPWEGVARAWLGCCVSPKMVASVMICGDGEA